MCLLPVFEGDGSFYCFSQQATPATPPPDVTERDSSSLLKRELIKCLQIFSAAYFPEYHAYNMN